MASQESTKPDFRNHETYCPQEAEISQNEEKVENRFGTSRAASPVDNVVHSDPSEEETDIQHQGNAAGETCQINHSSQFSRETQLNDVTFSNEQHSFQNAFRSHFDYTSQSELNLIEPFETNYNSNSHVSPFHVSQTNLLERITSQKKYLQSSLIHDRLDSIFLNKELIHFETELLQSTEEHFTDTEISTKITESPEKEHEPSSEASQCSLTNAEKNPTSKDRYLVCDVHINGSDRATDTGSVQSKYSIESQSQFYENSMEPHEVTYTKEICYEREDQLMNELKKKQNDENKNKMRATVLHGNRVINPEQKISLNESKRLPLTSDVSAHNVINRVVDKRYSKVVRGPIVSDDLKEDLTYESKMREINAIDSSLFSVEQKIKVFSNFYDLDKSSVKNTKAFRDIKYVKGETASFIPETIEIIVMTITVHLCDSPPPSEREETQEPSPMHDVTEELDASNIPESSITLEAETCQETSSQINIEDRLPDDTVATADAIPIEPLSLTQTQQIEPSVITSACNPQGDDTHVKIVGEEPEDVNLQSQSDVILKTQDITEVSKNDTTIVDESAIVSKIEKRSHCEEGTRAIIAENMDITGLTSAIHLEGLETEVQEKIKIPCSKVGSQSDTEKEQPFKKDSSFEVTSIGVSPLPQMQKSPCSSADYSTPEGNVEKKDTEDNPAHKNVSEEPSRHDDFGETQTPDIATNQLVDKNEPVIVDEPAIFDKSGEIAALPIKEKDAETDSSSINKNKIETNTEDETNKIISGTENMITLPTDALPEHQLSSEINVQEMQNPAGDLPEPNTSESLTIIQRNPSDEKVSQGDSNVDQLHKEGHSTEDPSVKSYTETQTQQAPVSDESTIQEAIHDNIEIQISPSELAWLSEPETQTEIRTHPCFEQLENYQVPLSIEGMLQITMPGTPRNQECTEELPGQLYSEEASTSRLLDVSEMAKQNPSSDRQTITEREKKPSEAARPITTPVPSPKSDSIAPLEHEPILVSIESESSNICVESLSLPPSDMVSTSSGLASSSELGNEPIADKPSDDDAPLAKRKRTVSKSAMKLNVKETRKSSRVKKNPERLFYIGKGQLF